MLACSARDVVRPEAAEAVALLSKLGCSAAMLTGDAAAAAQAVGAAVGLPPDHVHAQLLPEQKLNKVGPQACGVAGVWGRECRPADAVHAAWLQAQQALGSAPKDAPVLTASRCLLPLL